MTIILKTNAYKPDPEILRKAADILIKGGLVAFPTETVYGLGAVVYDENAAKRIFLAKMRPPDNPLIIHIENIEMLNEVAVNIPEEAYKLIKIFWPGPLTLVLPRHPRIPRIVTGGLDTVAVRMPAHPVALELIKEVNTPIAAPSANLAGRPSPTRAQHVITDLYGRIDAIIDAGETLYGVESTIINMLVDPPLLLRPGAYTIEDIERVLGKKIEIPEFARGYGEAEIALAPGIKYRHYAPETLLILVEVRNRSLIELANTIISTAMEYLNRGEKTCIIGTSETINMYSSLSEKGAIILELGSRNNLFEIARNLFNMLRELDSLSCNIALVEGVEEKGLGLTIMNRLRKASSRRL